MSRMGTYRFLQVDAFTTTPLEGNACAVVLDADPLSEETMQAVAREMNLSETAFVRRSERADIAARYFTPAEEIPLAGHPTIATLHALVEEGRIALDGAGRAVRLELPAGVITVELKPVRRGDGAHGVLVAMEQLAPRFMRTYEGAAVAAAFGLEADDLLSGAPVQTVSTGTPQLMVPVKTHEVLRRARLEREAYLRLRSEGDFFSPHLFCLGGATSCGDTFARHFGVPPDTFEDPFTGSATGGMAAYLWHHGLLAEPRFVAEQGHWMGRPGLALVEVSGPPDAIAGVRVSGEAVTVVRGELTI